ncbi:MAG: HAD-IIIA family hydrolase [Pseudomonadales bacterium]|nr:HAD-IIIA family hydrolase [Gammaproteobacteria bacterium]NNL57115.1 HAD-IIIA family hydrolase [Pseudomonadales bacterium]
MNQAAPATARGIKLLVLDVDGVLTDGGLYFGASGEQLKRFSILDGLGIKLLADCQIQTAIITGRSSAIVQQRAAELNIAHVIQGREDKLQALQELLRQLKVSQAETAYVGDDLPDLAAINYCQFGVAVANAHSEVKKHANWVCQQRGGNGAVREVADILLQANNHYAATIAQYV